MKGVAVYMRVSTRDQDADNQLADCLRLCEARGWATATVYRETGSGVKQRPVWDKVRKRAHAGHISTLVIWSLDRVGRRMFEIIADVRELARVGCRVISVREPFLDNDQPDLLLAVFAWVAQHEHQRISDRTKAGLARAAAQGRFPGRPGGLTPQALEQARFLRLHRMGWAYIARDLSSRMGFGGPYTRWQVQRAVEDVAEDAPAPTGTLHPPPAGKRGTGTPDAS